MRVRHARVRPAPYIRAAGASRYAGERRTSRRVSPAPHIRAEIASLHAGETCTCPPYTTHACGERFAPCGRDTHVSVSIHTYVRRALRAMRASHPRLRPAPHIHAERALRNAGETRTCPLCTTPTCRECFAPCRRDTHV